jgi:hypothetical protein
VIYDGDIRTTIRASTSRHRIRACLKMSGHAQFQRQTDGPPKHYASAVQLSGNVTVSSELLPFPENRCIEEMTVRFGH